MSGDRLFDVEPVTAPPKVRLPEPDPADQTKLARRRERELPPYTVECPVCGERPGFACRWKPTRRKKQTMVERFGMKKNGAGEIVPTPHPERIAAAEEAGA